MHAADRARRRALQAWLKEAARHGYRARKQCIQPGDRAALKRLLSVLREAGISTRSAKRASPAISSARDRSAAYGTRMCWSLRAFLRYLHHKDLDPRALAGCVPSIRRWKLASLPTYLSAAQVQKVLDGCDRATTMGRRDYAILMLLAKLGLRAGAEAGTCLGKTRSCWR